MMKKQLSILLMSCALCCFNALIGQDSIVISSTVDYDYLEDQFYFGVAYNALTNRPNDIIQRNFSYNIQAGFIKDIPINAKRNFGFGLGVGYATNSYYSDIIAEETETGFNYRRAVSSDSIARSKFETHGIEFPFEIRWRTSNAVNYKFWRVYTGVKAAYLFSRRSKFVSENNSLNTSFNNTDIAQWQYGLTLSVGYNTWNMYLYYGLNSLLDENALLEEQVIEIQSLQIGLVFYFL